MAAHYPLGSSSTPPPYSASSSIAPTLGQTRSRTLLFLSYRDSAGPSSRRRRTSVDAFQAPYSGDDPLGSSHADHADTEGLLLRRRSGEGHVALSVELPPKWLDVSDQVDALLSSIRPRMDALSRLHERHLRPGFADKSAEEQRIEALAVEITRDFRRCSRLVAGLAGYTQHLMRAAKQGQGTVREVAVAQNVQTALATRVQDLSGAFRKQQTLYLRRMRGMEVRDRDLRAARGLAPPSGSTKGKEPADAFRDSELAVREDIELSRELQSNLLLDSSTDRHIAQRSREIDEIAKSIQDLATLFTDLQTLVIDQGTLLDRIDYNVELMARETRGAVQELETATRYQRRSGRRQCILFLCLLIALLVAVIVAKPFWRAFGGGSKPEKQE